jgi:hypothetical protein
MFVHTSYILLVVDIVRIEHWFNISVILYFQHRSLKGTYNYGFQSTVLSAHSIFLTTFSLNKDLKYCIVKYILKTILLPF